MPATKPLKCSKKLFDKMTPSEQKKWKKLNKIFFDEMMILSDQYPVIKSTIPILAHNLACVSVWKRVITKPE